MHFVKFHPEVASCLLSRGKWKDASLGMRLLWKYIRNDFLVYHLISHFLLYLQNYKEFEAESLDLQSEKYRLSFDIKKYATSGWALEVENVIGIRAFNSHSLLAYYLHNTKFHMLFVVCCCFLCILYLFVVFYAFSIYLYLHNTKFHMLFRKCRVHFIINLKQHMVLFNITKATDARIYSCYSLCQLGLKYFYTMHNLLFYQELSNSPLLKIQIPRQQEQTAE